MKNKLLENFESILNAVMQSAHLPSIQEDLFHLSNSAIITPVGNVFPLLLKHKSKLKDQIIDSLLFNEFISTLNKSDNILRINHIGFCYRVISQQEEKERISDVIKKQKTFHLYEMGSYDEALWLFIGNAKKWEDPMVELLPIEKTQDKWVNYWLPHIQIDIDTNLKAEEIIKTAEQIFKDKIKPYSMVYGGVVYTVRIRLGIIDGVNLELDIATNARDAQFSRHHLLNFIA